MLRKPPNIELTIPDARYATLLCTNYDWWQEALNLTFPFGFYDRLAEVKARAIELDDRRKATAPFSFGGEEFQMQAVGGRGKEYILVNDDFRVEIGTDNAAMQWTVTWRATSAGLWEYGVHALRKRVYCMLKKANIVPRHPNERWQSLSRVDFAFDFWSPEFSNEMVPDIVNSIVAPAPAKWRGDIWGNCALNDDGEVQAQTVTIGSKKGCQVQIYDKTAEIVEASGKEWMLEIWGERGGYWPSGKPQDVWRLEARMAGDWLKERIDKDPDIFFEKQWQLIADALFNRRLTVPSATDKNRWRWPLHPLYSLAIEEIENPQEFVPVGRKVTMRRDHLTEMLINNVAGTLRSTLVLANNGPVTEETATNLAARIVARMLEDKDHLDKIERAENRYELVEEAR